MRTVLSTNSHKPTCTLIQHGRVFTPGTALPGNPYTIHLSKVLLVCSHMCMKKSRTTLPLEEKDREAFAAIRDFYEMRYLAFPLRLPLFCYARSLDKPSLYSTNFANRFFLRFSRSTQLISRSPHVAHSCIREKPFSGDAAVTTLTV